MSIEYTSEQQESIDKIGAWLSLRKDDESPDRALFGRDKDWEYRMGGFGGTGKTTTIGGVIDSTKHDKIVVCAPTGKAASVLTKKLDGREVMTIHKALYNPIEPSQKKLEELHKAMKDNPDDKAARIAYEQERKASGERKLGFSIKAEPVIDRKTFVIVDEASMVNTQMREDLHETGAKVLFVGDPGQLPPVGDGGWFVKGKLDSCLKSIHRQALESPIVRLSMKIREGSFSRADFQTPDCRITRKSEGTVSPDDWMSADQIITGRNFTRHKINRFIRKRLGRTNFLPVKDERLICLKNENVMGVSFINGLQCVALSDAVWDEEKQQNIIDILIDEKEIEDVPFYDYHCRKNYDGSILEAPWNTRRNMREFDFAYAITCHKSQGSEWDSVIIADDYMNRKDKEFRRRWLYTAVTRAKSKLLWVQDD